MSANVNVRCVTQRAPSLLAELASIPIALVTFLYGLRIVKYFCIIDISDVLVFVFDTVVGFFWFKIFN